MENTPLARFPDVVSYEFYEWRIFQKNTPVSSIHLLTSSLTTKPQCPEARDSLRISFWLFYFILEGKDKCFDLVTRKSYRVEEIWTRGDFACTACVCKRSGRLNCWAIQCNDPSCKNSARAEGRCCRFCLDTYRNKGLSYATRISSLRSYLRCD